jgi:hypothetical protein
MRGRTGKGGISTPKCQPARLVCIESGLADGRIFATLRGLVGGRASVVPITIGPPRVAAERFVKIACYLPPLQLVGATF